MLFPDFIRAHFKKEEMSKFISDNIQSFTIDGTEKLCSVELFSGPRFASTLTIKAKFFTAKSAEALKHWHMNIERNGINLESKDAVPIGLEMDGGSRRDELRRKTKEYIQSIIHEPAFADQVTDSLKHTQLPRKVLQIVQQYNHRSEVSLTVPPLSPSDHRTGLTASGI